METAYGSMKLMKAMADIGNPNSVTDTAVGALCARTAVIGAFLNVKINCVDYNDKSFVRKILEEGQKIVDNACLAEEQILQITNSKI